MNQQLWYAGIDLHKRYAYVTVVDSLGYVQKQGRFNNNEGKLIPELLSISESGVSVEAIVESTYGWYWLADKLENAKIPFVLAHPKKIKAVVGRKKTDKEDSKALADLYRTNLLPQVYIPTKEERALREPLRFRFHLVQQQKVVKIKLRDILQKHNIQCQLTDILGKRAKEWLQSLKLPFPYGEEVATLLAQSEYLDKDIKKFDQKITEQSSNNPNAKLLTTIPGVGQLLALTLAVEIGDINISATDRALASYAGLVPSVSSSGDKTHRGKVSSQANPYIKWALAESLVHLVKKDPGYQAFYANLVEKKGKPKAKVAVMNKLSRAIFVMLKKQMPFRKSEIVDQTSL